MVSTVPYHLGPGDSFSLGYVTPDRERFREHLNTYAPPTQVITVELPTTTPVFLTYTSTPPTNTSGCCMIPDHPFVETYLRVFAGVVDGRRASGDDVIASKSADLDDVPSTLTDRIEWKKPIPDVGGQLLSNLILTHPLPNANHRTSLGTLLVYLQSVGADLTVEDLRESGVDTYIQESKRLLTVRRNATKFRILEDCGCTTVERKGGIHISLDAYDFDVDDPYSEFAREHERHSIEFVERIVNDNLTTTCDPGLRVFLARLDR